MKDIKGTDFQKKVWSEITKIPIVAIGGINSNNYKNNYTKNDTKQRLIINKVVLNIIYNTT